MRCCCRLKAAAQCGTMHCRDEWNIAARHRFKIGVAVELKRQALGAAGFPAFRRPAQVKAGTEIVTVAEDDAALGLLTGALDGDPQLLGDDRVEAVALVGAIKSDKGNLALQFVGDHLLFAHKPLLGSAVLASPAARCLVFISWD